MRDYWQRHKTDPVFRQKEKARAAEGLSQAILDDAQAILDDAQLRDSGDPAVAALQGASLVAATLWRVCAEICRRLGDREDRHVVDRAAR